ncbi:MAG TPA: GNAT family N-acetyltransferase [Clostridiales bacterium]|nr:GNAT family N-acetyltransferase [Clostridiales bacterium]
MNHHGTEILETNRLILRKFTLEDGKDMFNNWASSSAVTEFMTWPPYQSKRDVEEYIDKCIDDYRDMSNYNWCIVNRENNQAIGSIGVVSIREDISEAAIGYCLGERYWHQGIMTEAFNRVIQFLFKDVSVNRIKATHDTNNPNSGGVMRKCGLTYEGTLRKSAVNNTGVYDSAVYSILKSEYEK